MMKFEEKLKQFRTNKFYSQADLAEECSTAVFTVSRWETGSSFPTYKTIVKICLALDIIPNDFLDADITDQKKVTEIKRAQNYYDKYEASKSEENKARSNLEAFGEKYRKANQSNSDELEQEKENVLNGMLKAHNAKQELEFDMFSEAYFEGINDCEEVRNKIIQELQFLTDKGLYRLQRFIEYCLFEDDLQSCSTKKD